MGSFARFQQNLSSPGSLIRLPPNKCSSRVAGTRRCAVALLRGAGRPTNMVSAHFPLHTICDHIQNPSETSRSKRLNLNTKTLGSIKLPALHRFLWFFCPIHVQSCKETPATASVSGATPTVSTFAPFAGRGQPIPATRNEPFGSSDPIAPILQTVKFRANATHTIGPSPERERHHKPGMSSPEDDRRGRCGFPRRECSVKAKTTVNLRKL